MTGIIVGVVLVAFAAWTGIVWNFSGTYHTEALVKQAAAKDDRIKELEQEQLQKDQKAIDDKQKAFEDGKAQGKVVIQQIAARGASDVQRYPVFKDPNCVLPDASLALLNSARASLRTGKLADMPTPAPAPVAAPAPASETHTAAPSTTRGSGHPKPKPVNK